jgi:hypothetical protein
LLTGGPAGGIAVMLTPLLDRNRDGSMLDDVTYMFGRFMKRPQNRAWDLSTRPGFRQDRRAVA